MSGGQSCDVSVRDPAGGAENFVLATPPPACGEGGHETPPVVKVVVRLTRSLQDFVLATPCWKWRWWTTRRALYELVLDATSYEVEKIIWKKTLEERTDVAAFADITWNLVQIHSGMCDKARNQGSLSPWLWISTRSVVSAPFTTPGALSKYGQKWSPSQI